MRSRPLLASRPLAAISSAALVLVVAWATWAALEPGGPARGDSARTDGVAGATPDVGIDISRALERPAAPDAPPGTRTGTAPAGVLVRVLDRRSSEPVEGFVVSMIAGDELLGEEPTDGRGEVRFRAPRTNARVNLFPPYGWSAGELVREVEFREDGRYEDVLVLAGPADHGRFRGRFVDASTGEAVPHYMARVRIGEATRVVVSGPDGRFATADELPAGPARIRLFDWIGLLEDEDVQRPSGELFVEHAPVGGEAPELELSIQVGPTYRIEAEFPRGVPADRWAADIVARPGGRILHPLRPASQAPLRFEGGAWVRFRPSYRDHYAGRAMLRVTSADGAWHGSADVSSLHGIAPDPVPISFSARGRLVVRVVDTRGEPVPRASVECEPALALTSTTPVIPPEVSSANGLVEFVLLPAGDYVVRAISTFHERAARLVEVGDARRVDVELRLAARAGGGEVSGRVEVPPEVDLDEVRIRIEALRPSGSSQSLQLALAKGEHGRSAPFRFAELHSGDYRVAIAGWRGRADEISWSPHVLEVTVPADDLLFRGSSSAPMRSCRFEAVDATSGESLVCDVGWRIRGKWMFVRELEESFFDEPSEIELWRISSPGHVAREVAVDWGEDPAVVRTELERGWGLDVLALGPGFSPLEGVEIVLDGTKAGSTGADGSLALRRDQPPAAIGARYGGWLLEAEGRRELLDVVLHRRPAVRLIFSPN